MIAPESKTQPQADAEPIDVTPKSLRRRSRQGLVAAIAATIAVALIATAIVFAIATGTTDTADQGTVGILAEASLSAAASAHNETAQAQVLAEANSLGVAAVDELDQALNRAQAASAELIRRAERFSAALSNPELADLIRTQIDAFTSDITQTIDQMRNGDLKGSATSIQGDLGTSYRALAGTLAARRDAAMAHIALAGEDAGRLADAARFLVVLLVPLAVLPAYRKRIRREQHQRDLEHQIEKQEAVTEARDEFIANLSHELRTPLTAIYGFSLELIEPERTSDPVFDRELATYIASESAELSRMVEDILAAASEDQNGLSISLGTVDPVAEIESVLAPLRATGGRIESDLGAARITTDPLRFRQIIRNLVSNALRHGGPNNLVSGRYERGIYTVEVRDDGHGIPASLEERLFSRFIHQGDEPLLTGSVGLGLAIAQLLTVRTDGTISYRREHNETVFAVSFPLAAEQPAPSDPIHRDPVVDHDRSVNPGTRPPARTAPRPHLISFESETPTGDSR